MNEVMVSGDSELPVIRSSLLPLCGLWVCFLALSSFPIPSLPCPPLSPLEGESITANTPAVLV